MRLAFPTYIIVFFTLSMYLLMGSGPAFYNVINYNIVDPLKSYWWTILLFVQNMYPWMTFPGLYWMYYVANDFQFYVVIMMPAIYLYHN